MTCGIGSVTAWFVVGAVSMAYGPGGSQSERKRKRVGCHGGIGGTLEAEAMHGGHLGAIDELGEGSNNEDEKGEEGQQRRMEEEDEQEHDEEETALPAEERKVPKKMRSLLSDDDDDDDGSLT